jgi:hypothetical protein
MQNSNLKNSLIAAGIAVFAGVVTLGANVAFGGTNPVQTPAAAGLIAPTFSGLDVRGGITNTTGTSPVLISDPNGLDVISSIRNSTANGFLGDGALKVNDDLDLSGTLLNSAGVEIKVGDWNTLHVQDSLKVDKNASIGPANNPDTSNNYFTVWANTNLKGVLDVVQDVVVHGNINLDNLKGGSISNVTNINTAPGKNIVITSTPNVVAANSSSLTVHGDGKWNQVDIGTPAVKSNLTVNGDANATGEVKAGTWLKTHDFQSTGALWSDGSAYFKHLEVFNEGVGSVFMETGNVKASGKITAKGGFGTYTIRPAVTAKGIDNNSFNWSLQGCNAGEIIVSCYSNSYSSDPGASFTSNESGDMSVSGLYIYNNQCEANYKNTSGSKRYVKAAALCLDPSK